MVIGCSVIGVLIASPGSVGARHTCPDRRCWAPCPGAQSKMPGGVPGAVRPYHCEGSLHAEGGLPWGFSSTAGKGPQLSATVIDTPGAPDQRAPRSRSSLVDLWPRVRG